MTGMMCFPLAFCYCIYSVIYNEHKVGTNRAMANLSNPSTGTCRVEIRGAECGKRFFFWGGGWPAVSPLPTGRESLGELG